jgi:hypothetical protein
MKVYNLIPKTAGARLNTARAVRSGRSTLRDWNEAAGAAADGATE